MPDMSESTELESPSPRSSVRYAVIGIALMLLIALVVIVVLALLGPSLGTIYTDIGPAI